MSISDDITEQISRICKYIGKAPSVILASEENIFLMKADPTEFYFEDAAMQNSDHHAVFKELTVVPVAEPGVLQVH